MAFAEQLSAPAGAPPRDAFPSQATPATAEPTSVAGASGEATGLQLDIVATEDDLFVLNQTLSKLRDLLGGGTMRLSVSVEARTAAGQPLDRVRARNTVIEPLEEDPDVRVDVQWLAPSGDEH